MSRAAEGAGPVRYRSTRDPSGAPVAFDEALRRGLAPDGGLYVPDRVPSLAPGWATGAGWHEVVDAVLRPWFAGDPGADDYLADAVAALDFDVPVVVVDDATVLLELHHGPTLAFKDVAARTMARWLARSLRRRGERATILVATSGDTGGAVADGFAGLPGLEVVVLYPSGRVSPVQERQLTVPRAHVHALAVEGDFDDCQRLVKTALVDPALTHLAPSSANSINVGRLLPQATYHAWGALQTARVTDRPLAAVVDVVPSGNLGNLTAGLLAAAMGLGVAGAAAAHNANDLLVRVLDGRADPSDRPATVATSSNAMDVGAPSNLERLVALFPDGAYPLPLAATSVDDADTAAAMRRAWFEHGTLVCPHTAVGLEAWRRLRPGRPAWRGAVGMVHATAHPAKFPEVVEAALPGVRARHERLDALPDARPSARIDATPAALRAWLLDHVTA